MANRRGLLPALFSALAIGVMLGTALPATAQDAAHRKFIIHLMNRLQAPSFAASVEYCGYLGYTRTGKLTSGPITEGNLDTCAPVWPEHLEVVASFHTHGGFTHAHYSEVPSAQDLRGDIAEEIDGWIATPGGRLWFVDHARSLARQICGIGCLKQDPRFIPRNQGPVATQYTLDKLVRQIGD